MVVIWASMLTRTRTPAAQIITEIGDFLITESGNYLITE